MNTYQLLNHTAIECLRGMIMCHLQNDLDSLNNYTSMYSHLLQDIADYNNSCLTDAQLDYVFSETVINENGELNRYPENE